MTAAREPGLTADEVAERVRTGRTNDLPERGGRSTGDIIRANVFTRINAILGSTVASTRSRDRCCLAQPDNIASNTATGSFRCATPGIKTR